MSRRAMSCRVILLPVLLSVVPPSTAEASGVPGSSPRVAIMARGLDELGAAAAPVVREQLAAKTRQLGWTITDLETLRLDAGLASELLVPLREAGVQLVLEAGVSGELLGASDLDRRFSSVEVAIYLKAHAPQTSDVVYEREWRATAVDVTAKTAARKAAGVALSAFDAAQLRSIAQRLDESAIAFALCGIGGDDRALVEEIVGRFRPVGAAWAAEFRAGCWQLRFPVAAAMDGLKVASSLAAQSPVPLRFDEISSKGLRATMDVQAGPLLPLCTRATEPELWALLYRIAELDVVGEVGTCAPEPAVGLRLEAEVGKGGGLAVTLIRRVESGKERRIGVVSPADRGPESIERAALDLRRQLQQALAKEARSLASKARVAQLEVTFPGRIELLAAQAARYEEDGAARVRITNLTDQPLHDLTVAGFVKGLSLLPGVTSLPTLAPRASQEIPLRLSLDVPSWPRESTARPRMLEIRVAYPALAGLQVERHRGTVVVFPPDTIDWKAPESFAAFVDDGSVAEVARAAIVALRPQGQVETILALMARVHSLELEYVRDRRVESGTGGEAVDSVQLPAETLARRTGDCDDLSALVAALLGSVGIATELVVTPEHVLLLADTGVSEHRGLVPHALPLLPVRGGRRFLPVDATALARGAKDPVAASISAWRAVADRASVAIIDLDRAKARYGRVAGSARAAAPLASGDAARTFGELRQALAKAAAEVAWADDAESRLRAATERARRSDNHAAARAALSALAGADSPPGVRRRAEHNLAVLGCVERQDATCLDALVRIPAAELSAGTERARLLANQGWLHAWKGDRERAAAGLEASAAADGGATLRDWMALASSERAARAGEQQPGDGRKLDLDWLRKVLQSLKRPDTPAGAESYPLGGRRGAPVSEATTVADGLFWL